MDGVQKSTDVYSYDKAGNMTKHVYSYSFPGGTAGKHVWAYEYKKIAR